MGWDQSDVTQSGLKLCPGDGESAACGTCEWNLMSAFVQSQPGSTVTDVVEYINGNSRWLGKYLSESDRYYEQKIKSNRVIPRCLVTVIWGVNPTAFVQLWKDPRALPD